MPKRWLHVEKLEQGLGEQVSCMVGGHLKSWKIRRGWDLGTPSAWAAGGGGAREQGTGNKGSVAIGKGR